MRRPPRFAELLLGRLLPRADREEVLGDLAESYRRRAARAPWAATPWYWLQVVLVPAWLWGAGVTRMRIDVPEVRRTVRSLAKSPGFTVVAVLSLGLGIGATTAISGAVRALLLVTLPVEGPDEMSLVYHTWPEEWERSQYGSSSAVDPEDGSQVASNISWPAYEVLKASVGPEVGLSAYSFVREMSVVFGDAPARVAGGMLVSGDYFTTLKLGMHLGRPLNPADDRPGARPVAVLAHHHWTRAFGADPAVVGETVHLNGEAFEIVGVARKGYVGLSPGGFFGPGDFIVPITNHNTFLNMRVREGETLRTAALIHWVRLIARIPADVDRVALSRAWSSVLAAHMAEAGVIAAGDVADMQIRPMEGRRGLDSLRQTTQGPLGMLSAVVAVVLLIACANLTTLLLARGAARADELALRRAIGASRWELARPQIVESLLLAGAGGVLGVVIALEGGPLIVSSLTRGAGTAASSYELNGALIWPAVVASLLAAGLSAWVPALRMMRTEPSRHLGVRSRGAGRRFGLGRALISAQIAISVPLIVGAGLFLRTLGNLVDIDPGFSAEDVVVFRVDAAFVTEDRERQQQLYENILADLEALPEVRSASVVENVLVSGWESNSVATVEGEERQIDMNAVSPGFFETMDVELRSGRLLTASDRAGTPQVVVVNETAERELFDGRALGRRFTVGSSREVHVVGVVEDTKYSGLKEEVEPGFFDSWLQREGGLYSVHYAIRSPLSASQLEPMIRQIVSSASPGLPVAALRAQAEHLDRQASRERVFAQLLTGFGAFALLLACIGLHGLMSFAVSQRRAEMGVRLALGATPQSIVRMVLSQVYRLTGIGIIVGLIIALQVTPLIRSMLFGVEPIDAVTLVASVAVMAAVALIAGSVPAIRASRVDPLQSLSP